MITGTVYIDLTTDPYDGDFSSSDLNSDRRALDRLSRCPDGASVVVDIGKRRYVTQDCARYLHDQDHRLEITISGHDPDAVRDFVRAARAGSWEVVV